VGECFFRYRPTRVVPDQRPLNCCVCVCVCVRARVRACVRVCVCLPPDHFISGRAAAWFALPGPATASSAAVLDLVYIYRAVESAAAAAAAAAAADCNRVSQRATRTLHDRLTLYMTPRINTANLTPYNVISSVTKCSNINRAIVDSRLRPRCAICCHCNSPCVASPARKPSGEA